jgi:hypothetical protein
MAIQTIRMPMVTDCCASAEDARRLVLNAAVREGWQFDLKLCRWLCPDCVTARDAQAEQTAPLR